MAAGAHGKIAANGKIFVKHFLAALGIALAAATATAEERAAALFNIVNLSAHAEREVPNDTLSAVMAVDSEGTDPVALAESVNRAMREALNVAQTYPGVKAKSLNYQTFPVYAKTRIVNWRIRQELRLESRDFAQATELIGRLQSTMLVSNLGAGLSPEARKQAENALIVEALAAFHERAALVRDAEKSKGYRVKEIQIGGVGAQPRTYAAARGAMASSPRSLSICSSFSTR